MVVVYVLFWLLGLKLFRYAKGFVLNFTVSTAYFHIASLADWVSHCLVYVSSACEV